MTESNIPCGPFETVQQAAVAAEPMYAVIRQADPGYGAMDDTVRAARTAAKVRYVTDTLTEWGVELGTHDEHIARWLVTWDPETVIVLLDWVKRAHAAATGLPRAWRVEASLNLPPIEEEIQALRATELADVVIESQAFDVRLYATVTAGTKAEASTLVRKLVATVPGLRVVLVDDCHPAETEDGGAR